LKGLRWAMLVSVLVHVGLFLGLSGQSAPSTEKSPPILRLMLTADGRGAGSTGPTMPVAKDRHSAVSERPRQVVQPVSSLDIPPTALARVATAPAEEERTPVIERPAPVANGEQPVQHENFIAGVPTQVESANPDKLEQSGVSASISAVDQPGHGAGAYNPPTLLRDLPPVYPDEARFNGWEGRVVLELLVGEDGRVAKVRVLQSSGRACLDQAAVTAARHWRYRPAQRNGVVTAVWVQRAVRFRLE